MDDDEIRALVVRLSRAHPSGGEVIGRAAIMAEGADLKAVVRWIIAHDGQPEANAPAVGGDRGLHSSRLTNSVGGAPTPVRYVLPAGALAPDSSAGLRVEVDRDAAAAADDDAVARRPTGAVG